LKWFFRGTQLINLTKLNPIVPINSENIVINLLRKVFKLFLFIVQTSKTLEYLIFTK